MGFDSNDLPGICAKFMEDSLYKHKNMIIFKIQF